MQITKREFLKKLGMLSAAGAAGVAGADDRAGSMNVRLNRQRFMAGWCDDYTVWVKDGKIGLRNLNLTRGVVVRAAGDPTRPRQLGEESAFAVEVRDESGRK